MAQQWGALIVLLEHQGLFPNTHMVAQNHLYLRFQRDLVPYSGLPMHYSQIVHRHTCRGSTYTHKRIRSKSKKKEANLYGDTYVRDVGGLAFYCNRKTPTPFGYELTISITHLLFLTLSSFWLNNWEESQNFIVCLFWNSKEWKPENTLCLCSPQKFSLHCHLWVLPNRNSVFIIACVYASPDIWLVPGSPVEIPLWEWKLEAQRKAEVSCALLSHMSLHESPCQHLKPISNSLIKYLCVSTPIIISMFALDVES